MSQAIILGNLAYNAVTEWWDDDYCNLPNEIAAQYQGYKIGYEILSSIYGEEKAESYLCQYANARVAMNKNYAKVPDDYQMEQDEYGHAPYVLIRKGPFTSMEQIYNQFQKTFEECIGNIIDYEVPSNDENDAVAGHINNSEKLWNKKAARELVEKPSDKMAQMFMMSAAFLEKHELLAWLKDEPALHGLKFPKTMKGLMKNAPPPPEKGDMRLDELKEKPLDYDASDLQEFADAVARMGQDKGMEQ